MVSSCFHSMYCLKIENYRESKLSESKLSREKILTSLRILTGPKKVVEFRESQNQAV